MVISYDAPSHSFAKLSLSLLCVRIVLRPGDAKTNHHSPVSQVVEETKKSSVLIIIDL